MSGAVRIMPSGPHALLAEYASLAEVMNVASRLLASPPPGVIDVVPAARTILVSVHPRTELGTIVPLLENTAAAATEHAARAVVQIEVDYDGEDLGAVAAACGIGVDEIVQLHTGREYRVAFCGFVPGFSYLVGLDPRLHLPRRATPRTRVPAGSVAVASEFTAVYPTASPGGWHLLGHTDAVMWDDERDVPALLPPGTFVQFTAR
jgi:KipI family sensor histidine kinase inhibitor